MTLAQDFEDFVKLLNKHQVEYMVVGGYDYRITVCFAGFHLTYYVLIYGFVWLQ
jgi:hypothetical protein